MATLLLSCDLSVKRFEGKYYAGSKETFEFYNRYLRVFEYLRLAVRCEEDAIFEDGWVELDNERVKVINIPDFRGPKQYLGVYFKVGKSIKNITDGCDAAIIRLPSTIGQRVAHKVIKSGIPYAVEIVYDAKSRISNSMSFIDKLLWKIIDHDMQKITELADGVSCVTEHFLQKYYYSKKSDAFVSNYSTLSLEKSFFTAPRKFQLNEPLKIVHVANQVDYRTRKGHIQLIKIIHLLKKHGKRVLLTFVGEDYKNGVDGLKKMAKRFGVLDEITFTGLVDRTKLSDILDVHDLFVFPTAAEGLPRVVIEAMAKGLPCVISNVAGNSELISDDMLVDFLDIDTFVKKIELISEERTLYEAKSRQNFFISLNYESAILQGKRDVFYLKLKEKVK